MKKLISLTLALSLLALAACGVTTTPVTEADTPTAEPTPYETADMYALAESERPSARLSVAGRLVLPGGIVIGSGGEAYTLGTPEQISLERRTFSAEAVHLGETSQIEFDWYGYDGKAVIPGMDKPIPFTMLGSAWAVVHVSDNGGVYPMLAGLETNTLHDLLAGTQFEDMAGIRTMTLAPDGSSALVDCTDIHNNNPEWYYIDFESGLVREFSDEIPKEHALYTVLDGCVIVRSYDDERTQVEVRVVPTNGYGELGADSLTSFKLRGGSDGDYRCFDGERYVLVCSGGEISVFDILGGGSALIPDTGLGTPRWACFSPDGMRAMLVWEDGGGAVTALAVADFAAKTLTQLPSPGEFSAVVTDWLNSSAFVLGKGLPGEMELLVYTVPEDE